MPVRSWFWLNSGQAADGCVVAGPALADALADALTATPTAPVQAATTHAAAAARTVPRMDHAPMLADPGRPQRPGDPCSWNP
jgi:hypothetical protein